MRALSQLPCTSKPIAYVIWAQPITVVIGSEVRVHRAQPSMRSHAVAAHSGAL
ncbi:MAG: hypothetical protein OXT09_09505 [Myxococcales bacterium]|nr:hypothetical protein [Myxococcales bacterium]